MNIHIMYYGMLAEIAGQADETLSVDEGLTVGVLRRKIVEKYPEMQTKKFKIAVNQQIADDFLPVAMQAEIALLPPFAGG